MCRFVPGPSLNQYTSVGGTSYTYDDNGNLAYDGRFRYYYDCENRLLDVNDAANARVASYAYDYQGRRISRTIYGAPNVTIRYAYDGDRIIAEYDGSGTLLRKFVYGPGLDEPICLMDVGNGNAIYYYHFDGLGSVVALSNVNRVLVERYAYDVFGRPTIRDPNGVVLTARAFGNPYLFTARAYDGESGLYYYRARYYDFATGRFLQPDPTGYADGLNLYAYVGNNPAIFSDAYGLCKEDGFLKNLSKGKYVGTGYGESALRYYAKGYVEADSFLEKLAYGTGMAFSSLWQEETWKATVLTLILAYELDQATQSPPIRPATPPAEQTPTEPQTPKPRKSYRENDLPAQGGPPNDTLVKDNGNGTGQIRDYGPDGRAKKDFDFHPDHGAGDFHCHDWDWSKDPPRQPGRPVEPGD